LSVRSCTSSAPAASWPFSSASARIHDIAKAEKVTDRFVSRMLRLAYLSPDVLERLVISRDPPSVSMIDLIEAVNLPWSEQMGQVFEDRH